MKILTLGVTPKLGLVFVFFAAVLLAGIGLLAYYSGQAALEAATIAELRATALEKEAALNAWVKDRRADVAALAASPHLLKDVAALHSPEWTNVHERLVAELRPHVVPDGAYLEFFILDPETGEVIVSTNPAEEGKFKENDPYFLNGRRAPYIQNVYYSPVMQEPAMTAAAPLRATNGRLLGVLAARLNLGQMNAIVQRRTGLHQSDDAFLINTSSLFVTQPRFVSDPVVLQRGIHTTAVQHCLTGGNGTTMAADYRGVLALIAYHWLPERQMCLIIKVDQAEALAPVHALGRDIALAGSLALVVASVLGFALARTISIPIKQLVMESQKIGSGQLDTRIEIKSGDELEQLAGAFSHLAADLQETLVARSDLLKEIVEHKLTEQALRESQGQLQAILDYSPALISTKDLIGTVTMINKRLEEVITPSREAFVGKNIYDLFPYEVADTLWKNDLAARNGPIEAEETVTHKDGSLHTYLTVKFPLLYPDSAEVFGTCAISTDISARKWAEAALSQSEAFTRAILGSLKAHIAVLNQVGAIIAVNPAWEQFAADNGDPTHRQTGVGINYLDVCRQVVGEEATMAQAVVIGIQAVSANLQEQFSLEYPCPSPNEQRWFMMRVTPLRDSRGSVVVTHEEITGRVQAEQETSRRNRELTLLNQIIAASASSMEPETMLETACRELAQFFDVSQVTALLLNEEKTEVVAVAEWLPQGWSNGSSRRFAINDDPVLTYLLNHGGPLILADVQHDPRLIRPQALLQQHRIGSLLALPLMVDGQMMGSLNLSDCQPRHFSPAEINLAWSVAEQVAGALAHSRLTQLHHRLNAAIEQAAEAVMITDVDGKVIYVNPAFEHVSGYSRTEAVGQYPRLLKSGKQDLAFYQELWATIQAGRVWQGRFVNKRKGGALYTEEATISPIKDESGQIINFVAVKKDITRELQLEQQYHQSQKMEALGRLTGGIAHDFNNLLTAINGFAELLKLQSPPDDSRQELVDTILRSGQRAAALVRQLLVFSRQQIVKPEVLSLNEVITELNKMLGRIIGEDIRMEVLLAPELWFIRADLTQIEQVIVNLAVNARDAMPHGGQLTIETTNIVLDGSYTAVHLNAQPGEYVLLAISDTGIGMSETLKTHIFEPFFTTKSEGQGTGLGLATVYSIVEQSGGTTWVYSEEGQGTTFKIYLPRARETAWLKDRFEIKREVPTGHETILVVEDNEAVRTLVVGTLQTQGYTVLAAVDGEEALRIAAAHSLPVQMLLTDLVMPRLNGKLLAEQLSLIYPGIKILFMSGYTDNTLHRVGVTRDRVNFLQKPFSPIILAQQVRRILDASS